MKISVDLLIKEEIFNYNLHSFAEKTHILSGTKTGEVLTKNKNILKEIFNND